MIMDTIRSHSGSSKPEKPDRPVAFEEGMQAFRPNHLVTIRNHVDGWSRHLYGVYRDGAWRFEFERER
jgi:hypothetical protein